MSRQMHFGTVFQIQYGHIGLWGGDGQDTLYDLFKMFDIETTASDIYVDDYEVERSELERLYNLIAYKEPLFREKESAFLKQLEKIEMSCEEFLKILSRLIAESDPNNEYVLISWY